MAKDKNDNDTAVLFPDIDLTIGDETISVREFTFEQSLKANLIARDLIADLVTTLGDDEDAGLEALDEVFAKHADAFFELLALSTGRPVAWLKALKYHDAEQLQLALWEANNHFFLNRVVQSKSQVVIGAIMGGEPSPSAKSSSH